MRVIKQHIRCDKDQYKILIDYAHYSNNLYNYALYVTKQYYRETNSYIGLSKLTNEVRPNENYKLLPAQTAQLILKLVDQNYRSYFALLRKKKNGHYDMDINTPKFRKSGDLFNFTFSCQNSKIKNNEITFFRGKAYRKLFPNINTNLKIKFTHQIDGKMKQIQFKPLMNGKYFMMYINYEENESKLKNVNKNKHLSIDLGINNLATCIDSSGHSFIMNGKPLKSYNRNFNKKTAKLKTILKVVNNKYTSQQLQRLSINRNNYIDNYFNQIVSKVVKYCKKNNIGSVVIGYNEGWKTNVNLGKVNNQMFYAIPHFRLKQKLQSKCESLGIEFKYVNEAYTSKCSSVDLESVEKHDEYKGKRVKRGLFETSSGMMLNADVNGAANILRKVAGDVWLKSNQSVVGLMLNPVKIISF